MINFADYCSLLDQGRFVEAANELKVIESSINVKHPGVVDFLRDEKSLAQLASEVYVAYRDNGWGDDNVRELEWVGFEFGKPPFQGMVTFAARYK